VLFVVLIGVSGAVGSCFNGDLLALSMLLKGTIDVANRGV